MALPITLPTTKPLEWIGSSRKDLKSFPEEVQDDLGFALFEAQTGRKSRNAKPLKGIKGASGASVLEVVEDHDGDTYRAVYTVKFGDVIYVLHAFQKKSKKGIATPKHELDLVAARLRIAEEHHATEHRRTKP